MWMLPPPASPACSRPDIWWNPLIQSDALAASAAARVIIYRRDCRAAAKNISSPNLLELPGVVGPDGRNKRAGLCCSQGLWRPSHSHHPVVTVLMTIVSHYWVLSPVLLFSPKTSQDTQDKLSRARWKRKMYSPLVVLECILLSSMGGLLWLKEPSKIHFWQLRLKMGNNPTEIDVKYITQFMLKLFFFFFSCFQPVRPWKDQFAYIRVEATTTITIKYHKGKRLGHMLNTMLPN